MTLAQQVIDRAAQHRLPHGAVAVAAHDQQIGLLIGGGLQDGRGHRAVDFQVARLDRVRLQVGPGRVQGRGAGAARLDHGHHSQRNAPPSRQVGGDEERLARPRAAVNVTIDYSLRNF